MPSQAAVNKQISKLHNEMSEIRSLQATLIQQVIPRLEEGSAVRQRIDLHFVFTAAIKLENNSHLITDTITLYSHFVFSATQMM